MSTYRRMLVAFVLLALGAALSACGGAPAAAPTAATAAQATVAPAAQATAAPAGEPTAAAEAGEASPPEGAVARAEAIEKLIDELQPGAMLFNPPAEMQVDQPEVIVVRLTRDPANTELTTNVPGSGDPVVEQVPYVGMTMRVTLEGDAFAINALSDEEQIVPDEGYAQWSWQVTPIRGGTQQLFLTAAVSIELAKDDVKSRTLPVIQRDVNVQVNPLSTASRFLQDNWQLLISLPVVTTFASYLAGRYRSRAKAKREPDAHQEEGEGQ